MCHKGFMPYFGDMTLWNIWGVFVVLLYMSTAGSYRHH
jgi:hypothetical protein